MIHHARLLFIRRHDWFGMATVMEFTSPADEFPLWSVFETLPGVTVELERLIPHESLIIPYFWVRGAEVEDIETAFKTHAGVTRIRLIGRSRTSTSCAQSGNERTSAS